MAFDFAAGSPLANTLQQLVQPKLAEFGWTTGGDDTTLFDYILLMVANGKNEEQVATELSNDLLDEAEGESSDTRRFSRWLFEQLEVLRRQAAGGNVSGDAGPAQTNDKQMVDAAQAAPASTQDMEMEGVAESGEGAEAATGIPTGPKAMRNGSGNSSKSARGGRSMLGQANKQMSRDDSALHRVRGAQGSGRINSHSREPPKGPRSQNIGRGLDAIANGRGAGSMSMGPGAMNGMNGMNMGAMPGMPMAPMGQNAMPGMLNPQQQMALMSMYEQQAQMMQQIFSGQTPAPYVNPNFQQGRGNKKLSNPRNSGQVHKQTLPPSTKFTKKESQDENMTDDPAAEGGEGMDVEGSRPDSSSIMCHFNQRCTKADCAYVHSSPAAPKGVVVDMSDTCTFGAACMNRKCVGKHPSPAQKIQYQAEQECIFYPNCRDQANCPYKHPTAPPCRNGANCTTPGCTFWHSSTLCKFTPCTNPRCLHKHVEGQKQGGTAFKGNVWVAPKNGEEGKKEHVSERKFIDENKEEELIIPGKEAMEAAEDAI